MYCINCGKEINQEINFCSSCGSENKLSEKYSNENVKANNLDNSKGYKYGNEEAITTSILKGITFIPNCARSILGIVGYGGYGYAMAWVICILLAPTWIIISIVVIVYRIFIMPKLKENNII